VIPGEDERNEETDAQEHGRAANDTDRPPEVLGNKAEHLDEEPCSGYIRDRPLGDLALCQALYEGCQKHTPAGWETQLKVYVEWEVRSVAWAGQGKYRFYETSLFSAEASA